MSFNPHLLPTFNAAFNCLAAIFLILGYRAIKQKKKNAHQRFMIAALVSATLFLCSYLTYHIFIHGVTRYPHQGILRIIYFSILFTHTPLAAIIIPFCAMAVYYAYQQNFIKHTRITKWLFPVWLYVSITGVLIYLMLYIF